MNRYPSSRSRRSILRLSRAAAFVVLLLLAPSLLAYVVKLKDGSLVFARIPYTVKGTRAIITLENGTVTQIPLDKVDVPGTDKYNKENFGNVVAIDTPQEKGFQLPTPVPQPKDALQTLIRQKRGQLGLPTPGPAPAGSVAGAGASDPAQSIDPILQSTVAHVFEGAGITQYRLTNTRGKTRLLATASSEQTVFNTLSAAARAITEAAARGRSASVEIVLATSSGEPAGTFEMTPVQAKLLVDKGVTIQDYFVKNVVF
ncbi:MAG TPA: hypothetical protein VIY96_11405 [Thermoanaerobaculia bacterium]